MVGWELVLGGLALAVTAGTVTAIIAVIQVLHRAEHRDHQRLVETPTVAIGADQVRNRASGRSGCLWIAALIAIFGVTLAILGGLQLSGMDLPP